MPDGCCASQDGKSCTGAANRRMVRHRERKHEKLSCTSSKCRAAATITSTSIASANRCRTIRAGLSRAISDRHFGVGGDGLILICPSDKADARMRMFNADGSESEMCGNGVRCVAKFVYDHGLVRKPTLTIETGRGVLTLELEISRRQGPPGARGHGRADPASRADSDDAARRSAAGGRRWKSPDHDAARDLRVDGQSALRHLRRCDHRCPGPGPRPQIERHSGVSAPRSTSSSSRSIGPTM